MKQILTLLVLVAAVIAIALSGCGGGGGGGGSTGGSDLTGPVSISISPTTATLSPGDTRLFSATVTGTSNLAVTWTIVEGSTGGTIVPQTANTALYTAPSVWNTFHVKVTSVADPSKDATAIVKIGPPDPPNQS